VLLLLAAASLGNSARADFINLTGAETAPNIAEITIGDEGVEVGLEVYVGDLEFFRDLFPDNWMSDGAANRPSSEERLQRFSSETLQFVTETGARLPAALKLVEQRLRKDRFSPFAGIINPVTGRRVPTVPEDKRVLYAELFYPFEETPKSLTIIPPLDQKGRVQVSIGFIAYHKAVPIIDFRYLSQPATVTLDWDDPWYTKFDNPNLKRQHKSAVMSFLYVEPREVRHEILVRARELQEWTDLGLDNVDTIDADVQTRVKERVRAFFVTRNPLEVDDAPATPASTRVEFLKISVAGLQVIEDGQQLDLSTAILGIILSYPVRHLPQLVTVELDLFSARVEQIPATSIDPAGAFLSLVEANDPTFEWRNLLRKYREIEVSPVVLDDGRSIGAPVLSVLLLVIAIGGATLAVRPGSLSRPIWTGVSGVSAVAAVLLLRVAVIDVANPFAGAPDEATSAQILCSVLANVSHAYREKDPAALRQALEIVVAAEGFPDVEEELGRALAIKVVGGGIARVDVVENLVLKDITALEGRSGFRTLAEWTAKASAGHWGHAHQRTIRFRALVELVDDDGAWKLAGITVVDAKRL